MKHLKYILVSPDKLNRRSFANGSSRRSSLGSQKKSKKALHHEIYDIYENQNQPESLHDYNDAKEEKILATKPLQQSHSAFDILRKNNIKTDSDHDSESSRANMRKLQEYQSGDSWSWMWLNHFSRQEQESHKRMKRYINNNKMIINNPDRFGSGLNNVTDQKKQHMQTMLAQDSCGNDFVRNMTGCPIEKVHKLKQKKRDKLKKYLVDPASVQNNYSKNKLQNGKYKSHGLFYILL